MAFHSKLSPSSAERWMECFGSVPALEGVPNTDSVYAAEGTRAHDLASKWLTGDVKAKPLDADNGMGEYVAVYTSLIRREAEGRILLVERWVSTEEWTNEKGGGGTSDAIIIDMNTSEIQVNDLKYGQGVMVYAERNKQMMLYGLGALRLVEEMLLDKVTKITLRIIQPRRDHIDVWECSREELLAFGDEVKAARAKIDEACEAAKTPAGIAEFLHPSSEACQWCPLKTTCSAFNGVVLDKVFALFDKDDPEKSEVRTPDGVYVPSEDVFDMVKQWAAAWDAYIDEHLNAGEHVPGWKLVAGKRGNKKWDDEKEVDAALRKHRIKQADAYNFSLKSPTAMEKVIGKKNWPEFVSLFSQADGRPTVAPASSKKEAIKAIGAEAFNLFD